MCVCVCARGFVPLGADLGPRLNTLHAIGDRLATALEPIGPTLCNVALARKKRDCHGARTHICPTCSAFRAREFRLRVARMLDRPSLLAGWLAG